MLTPEDGEDDEREEGVAPVAQPPEADSHHQDSDYRRGHEPEDGQVDDPGGLPRPHRGQDVDEAVRLVPERLALDQRDRTPIASRTAPRRKPQKKIRCASS